MENKSLEARKNSILDKVTNFVKNLFKINQKSNKENYIVNEKNKPKRSSFGDDLKIEKKRTQNS